MFSLEKNDYFLRADPSANRGVMSLKSMPSLGKSGISRMTDFNVSISFTFDHLSFLWGRVDGSVLLWMRENKKVIFSPEDISGGCKLIFLPENISRGCKVIFSTGDISGGCAIACRYALQSADAARMNGPYCRRKLLSVPS